MKNCTECGGQIEDSSLHDFHYVISTCVKNLKARVEKSEAAAITFATKLVKKAVLHFPEDGEWFIVNNIAYPEKEYLLAQGILERKPDAEHLFRWTAQAKEEKG